jgi:phage tail-like protein
MSAAAYRAPPPAPPHDPYRTRLSAMDGWRTADPPFTSAVTISGDGRLRLELASPGPPTLLDPSGTLGGLVPPPHIAWTGDGTLYLLDRTDRRLLWFDPCECRFLALPCLAAPSAGDPRRLAKPVAIAADARSLVIADGREGGAVLRLSRANLGVLDILQRDWLPGPVAIDRCGRIYIADLKHGAVHRFTPDGRWQGEITGVGIVNGLATDQLERLYVISTDRVRRYSAEAAAIDEPADGDELQTAFARLPFALDALGRLVLGELCRAHGAKGVGHGLFDEHGEPVDGVPAAFAPPGWAKEGRFLTTAIDSGILGCVWHRAKLLVDLPPRTGLVLRSRTDEIAMPLDLIGPAAAPGWSAPQSWRGPVKGEIECLFVSPPGRLLWLEIGLQGPGDATPAVADVELEFPRISLRRYLPAALGADPVSAEFTDRFLAIFDQGFRGIERHLDRLAELFDPRSTPASMLAWLAGIIGLILPVGANLEERRRLLHEAPRLYGSRGTLKGMERLLQLHLGLDRLSCRPRPCPFGPACPPEAAAGGGLPKLVLEHWRLRRWLVLGQGRLGEASRLWGERILNRSRLDQGMQLGVSQLKLERDPLRDPFHAHAHAFSVFLPAARARKPVARRRIEALIREAAPSHTQPTVHWVEPYMRLGLQCTLGFDTVLGAPGPIRMKLDDSRLGQAAAPGRDRPPALGITLGRTARLGSQSRLN